MPPHTMEAIQFDKKKEQILLIQAPYPIKPIKNEVIVEVAYAGICGTDLHIAEVWQHTCPVLVSLGLWGWHLILTGSYMLQGLTFWTLAIIIFLFKTFRGPDSISILNGFSFFVSQTMILWTLVIILHMAIGTMSHAVEFRNFCSRFLLCLIYISCLALVLVFRDRD